MTSKWLYVLLECFVVLMSVCFIRVFVLLNDYDCMFY